MNTWKIGVVQMDCRLGDRAFNLAAMRARLKQCAEQGARLIVFPECILSGYAFTSKEQAWPHAETIPGPSTKTLAEDCRQLGVWAVVGLLEQGEAGRLFNACVLVGPAGGGGGYRKGPLPGPGGGRFTNPGGAPL